MSYKVIVLDIDGTLTNSKKEITEGTLQAIRKIQDTGGIIVLASGRPTAGIRFIADQLEFHKYGGYILAYNGAKVIDYKTGDTIYQKMLPKEVIPSLYEDALKYKIGLLTYDGDSVICGTPKDEFIEIEAVINKIKIKMTENFPEYVDFAINKCLMTGNPEELVHIEKEMQEKYSDLNIYRSEPFFLEIMPKNIDKAYSLGKLLEHLHLTKEEMICIGDGFNDLSMIKFAGLGVAMENAQETVKEAADFVTLSNDMDGVAHVIQQFWFR